MVNSIKDRLRARSKVFQEYGEFLSASLIDHVVIRNADS